MFIYMYCLYNYLGIVKVFGFFYKFLYEFYIWVNDDGCY